MRDTRTPKRSLTRSRSAWQSGKPGGILWLLKWLALLALLVLLILAVIPSNTAFAVSGKTLSPAQHEIMLHVTLANQQQNAPFVPTRGHRPFELGRRVDRLAVHLNDDDALLDSCTGSG